MRRSLPVPGALVAAALFCASGCAGSAPPAGGSAPLPFAVRVTAIDSGPGAPLAATPPGFGGGTALARRAARELEAAALFTRVLGPDAEAADLELEVAVSGGDFGPGRILGWSAALSTFTWLFAGPLAWIIDDRAHDESNVVLDVTVRTSAGETAPRAVYLDRLQLRGLQIDFIDRARPFEYALCLLLPPWIAPGDPTRAGESLAERSIGLLAEREPDQLVSRLPALYYEALAAYLLHDGRGEAFVLVSRRAVEQVRIGAGPGERVLNPDEVALCEVTEAGEKERLHQSTAGATVGIGTGGRHYRVPLAAGEHGLVRVGATLEGGAAAGPWTIEVSKE